MAESLKYDPITGHLLYNTAGHLIYECGAGGGTDPCGVAGDYLHCPEFYYVTVGGGTDLDGLHTMENPSSGNIAWFDQDASLGGIGCLHNGTEYVWRISIVHPAGPSDGIITWEMPHTTGSCPSSNAADWTLVTSAAGGSPTLSITV